MLGLRLTATALDVFLSLSLGVVLGDPGEIGPGFQKASLETDLCCLADAYQVNNG